MDDQRDTVEETAVDRDRRMEELQELTHTELLRYAAQVGDGVDRELVEEELERRFGQIDEDAWSEAVDNTDFGDYPGFGDDIADKLQSMDLSDIISEELDQMSFDDRVDFEKGLSSLGYVHESEIDGFVDQEDFDRLEREVSSLEIHDLLKPSELSRFQKMQDVAARGFLGRVWWMLTGK